MKKEDLRVTKSKLSIKQAFIELVEIKGYNKVSVSDIAIKANINRNTFYLHYEDKEHLVKEILQEHITKIEDALGTTIFKSFDEINEIQVRWGIRNLLKLVEPEVELYRIFILDKDLSGSFNYVNNAVKNALATVLGVRNPRSNIVFEYAISGIMGVIMQWIVYSNANIHEMAKIIAKMAYTNLVQFRTIN